MTIYLAIRYINLSANETMTDIGVVSLDHKVVERFIAAQPETKGKYDTWHLCDVEDGDEFPGI